ncbi:hypothetical protein QN277_019026 [Acacia crassicarpa]|uniref:Pentatricopeptide repeat-containing protein n=1 Tax=Acacia crassicarpa TaxID=499986 RepID=A0AAE1JSH9_9FABA|nr:hypothetical protein QN277_019026 [Acacia crassicarpa]
MITGLAIHGKGEQALALLYEMGANGMKPNAATFTSLFSACCHAGLVQEGLGLFRNMSEELGVMPNMQHYGCIVDLLGRAGRLKEAYDLIIGMPVRPDAMLWRSLLGASKIHGDEAMGEKVGKLLLQLDDSTPWSEDCVALSNVYASAERWNEVETVRKEMRVKGILNQAGCSSVQTVNFDAS